MKTMDITIYAPGLVMVEPECQRIDGQTVYLVRLAIGARDTQLTLQQATELSVALRAVVETQTEKKRVDSSTQQQPTTSSKDL